MSGELGVGNGVKGSHIFVYMCLSNPQSITSIA